jgi:hypothetical protein
VFRRTLYSFTLLASCVLLCIRLCTHAASCRVSCPLQAVVLGAPFGTGSRGGAIFAPRCLVSNKVRGGSTTAAIARGCRGLVLAHYVPLAATLHRLHLLCLLHGCKHPPHSAGAAVLQSLPHCCSTSVLQFLQPCWCCSTAFLTAVLQLRLHPTTRLRTLPMIGQGAATVPFFSLTRLLYVCLLLLLLFVGLGVVSVPWPTFVRPVFGL